MTVVLEVSPVCLMVGESGVVSDTWFLILGENGAGSATSVFHGG